MSFHSGSNFKTCHAAFSSFLASTYGLSPDRLQEMDSEINSELYAAIKGLAASPTIVQSTPLRQLNNQVLNKVKRVIVERYGLAHPHAASPASGAAFPMPMPNPQAELKPMVTSLASEKERVNHMFERLMSQRQDEYAADKPADPPAPSGIEESSMSPTDFAQRVAELESQRTQGASAWLDVSAELATRDVAPPDPKQLLMQSTPLRQLPPALAPAEDVVIEQEICKERLIKYALVNGHDRDPRQFQYRYQFAADLSGFRFRNVSSVEFTSLIIPSEIANASASSVRQFRHDFGLAQPYLMLSVKEMDGVYEGSELVRRATCMFSHDSTYQAPNGRGYVILRPLQNEMKVYSPTPLSTLPNLTLSVLKPNGAIFNQSQDTCKVCKIEYEPYNRLYLKLVTDAYFDRNEFFVGDTVLVRNMRLANAPALENYLNRPEGHDVTEVGPANQAGFHRFFYIRAPTELDQSKGTLELRADIMSEVPGFVTSAPAPLAGGAACTCDDPAPVLDPNAVVPSPPSANVASAGTLLNMSLQVSVSMRVTMLQGDAARVLQVQTI